MIDRGEQDPVETDYAGVLGDKEYTHPAFGNIQVSRVSGTPGAVLYGSDFLHKNWVVIRLTEGTLLRGLHHDTHYDGNSFAEVWLSESQWARMVSSLNLGSGVPCTIYQREGEPLPRISQPRDQVGVYGEEMRERASEAAATVQKTIDAVAALTRNLSGVKRSTITDLLIKLKQDMGVNTVWMVGQFDEHMVDMVDRAKVEVEAHVQAVIQRAGVRTIAGSEPTVLELASGGDDG